MAILELLNQTTAKNQIGSKIMDLKTELDKRLSIWQKISIEKKIKWVKSDKDPIISLAWDTYVYLRDNFFGEVR